MTTSRRRFLQMACAAGAVTTAPTLLVPGVSGAAPARHSLVLLVLRGGLDGLSAVVPRGDGRYRDNRRVSAVSESSLLPLDGDFGFHPALEPLYGFFRAGELAPVVGVGGSSASRSHFVQQSALDLGADALGHPTGWIARHLRSVHGDGVLRAMSSGTRRSSALRGAPRATAIADLSRFGIAGVAPEHAERAASAFRLAAGDGEFGSAAADALGVMALTERAAALERPSAYPDSRLGTALAGVAALLRSDAGLEVAVVDVGGWDTHTFQGGDDGRLADALGRLSAGLAAFLADIGDQRRSTTVVVVSEFGRRVEENASGGTDHGRGGVALVAGGGIRGGRVLGDWAGLAPDQLDDGDVRVTTDVRDVFAEVVAGRLGNGDLGEVFPGHRPTPVGFA